MNRVVIGGLLFCASTLYASAQVQITEIMYDPSGSDTGREWVEVQNTGGSTIDFTTWKFFEANVNHGIDQIEGYAKELQAGEFGVVVGDKIKFLADFPSFMGKIFKSSFSLSNSGENLAFKAESSGPIVDQYLYDVALGAAGDGNSLQKGTGWLAALPTPGMPTTANPGDGNGSGGGSGTGTTTATTTATTTPPGGSGGTGTTGTTGTSTPPANAPVVTGSGGSYIVPQLFGAVIAPPVALAGVDATLQAQAFTLGGRGVQNPRFAWNFGDGTIGQGASTTHRYMYPGKYHIALDATATMSNNDTSVLEHASLTVIAPDVSVSEDVDENNLRYIRIENETKYILEISSWIVRRGNVGGEQYVLPKNTFISPFTSIRLSQEVTRFKNDGVLKKVELLFPNRTLAASFDPTESAPTSSETPLSTTTRVASRGTSTVAPLYMVPKVASAGAVSQKIQPTVDVLRPEIVSKVSTSSVVGSSSTQNILTAAVTAPGTNNVSFLWYAAPLLVLVAGTALFLGRKKESDALLDYSIIDDEK